VPGRRLLATTTAGAALLSTSRCPGWPGVAGGARAGRRAEGQLATLPSSRRDGCTSPTPGSAGRCDTPSSTP
jgi:hypothetical protein